MNQKQRQRSEALFAALARQFYRHRWKTLLATFLFIGSLAAFIPGTEIDTSAPALLRDNDPARIAYNDFRDQFDENDLIVIAITPPAVFQIGFLNRLRAFHHDLEQEVPYVRRITSLINVRDTYGHEDELVVGELMETWPQTPADVDIERIAESPLL